MIIIKSPNIKTTFFDCFKKSTLSLLFIEGKWNEPLGLGDKTERSAAGWTYERDGRRGGSGDGQGGGGESSVHI